MQIPNNALVVVADGRRMLFLRNTGDDEFPNLQVETVREQENPSTADQGTDEPGSAFSNPGSGHQGSSFGGGASHRSGYEQTDFHQLEEDRFAGETAEMLKKRALKNGFDKLIVVAPPRTLGELRKHYHKTVEQRIVGEVNKDLTTHPVSEIEAIIKSA